MEANDKKLNIEGFEGIEPVELFVLFDSVYQRENKELEPTAKALGITLEQAAEIEDLFYGDIPTLSPY